METKTENRFVLLKAEILKRAREAHACTEQYGRAYKAESLMELMTVVKDNFRWCCDNDILTVDLMTEFKEEFAGNEIFCNRNVSSGYLLAWDNATVEASDNATVRAYGNATVRAWDNATVRASDNATVRAYGNATVRASDNATVRAWDNATVRASDNATVEASDNAYVYSYGLVNCKLSDNAMYRVVKDNLVYFASDNIIFKKQE